ncbi:PTS lactose transporter subunit IIC, putative [Babesia ovata]|uniref:PTS lactose transporter subunit IIC, putative n=1 Tax=Babesia ovata TaxID=189622 RepID=A0A2H6KFC9_9APIC|nr:PTS lactose transporter subunit IIC, putative [Babesia ovata]GBE61696.1 PTS lactose transporter subunit IIC, putative [Babesia ovata]
MEMESDDAQCGSNVAVLGPQSDPDSVLSTAAGLIRNYDYLEALSLLRDFEKVYTDNGDAEALSHISGLQAEIHVLLGEYKEAMRCLQRSTFSRTSALAAAGVALHVKPKSKATDLSASISDMLTRCMSNCSDEDHIPPNTHALLLEWSRRAGRLSQLHDWTVRAKKRGGGIRFFRDYPSLAPYLRTIALLQCEWLVDCGASQEGIIPYVTLDPLSYMDPASDSGTALIRSICDGVEYALHRERHFVFYAGSLPLSLICLTRHLKELGGSTLDRLHSKRRVNVVDGDGASRNTESPEERVFVKTKAAERPTKFMRLTPTSYESRPRRRRIVGSRRGSAWPCRRKQRMSLERTGRYPRHLMPSRGMEKRVSHIISERLRMHSHWSFFELGMLFFEVLSRYHHLLARNREMYTLYLCLLLHYIRRGLSWRYQSQSMSNGCLFTPSPPVDAWLLNDHDPICVRFRQTLRLCGPSVLCLIADVIRCPSAALADLSDGLPVGSPAELLNAAFGHLSSLLLLLASPSGAQTDLGDVVLRARVLFVMAKRLIREHLPRRGAVLGPRCRSALRALSDTEICLKALHASAQAQSYVGMRSNVHLLLCLRHRGRKVNFHNSLTHGSFDLGAAAVDRRWLSVLRTLQGYSMHA